MSESDTSTDAGSDQCRAVTDVAVQKAVERCGSEEAVQDVLADMFGFADDEENPDCETVLAGGIEEGDIDTTTAQRRTAMCVAWQHVKTDGMQFRSAVNAAWTKVREKEDELGV